MSEAEKKKRFNYRKNREKWIFAQAVIAVALALAVLICAIVAYRLEETYYISYTEDGDIDYRVFLKENDFYDQPYLENDQSYVASLIDHIVADFNYAIDLDADAVNYRYSYKINATLEIIDDTSDAVIFDPVYELKSANNLSQSSQSKLKINEIVVIDYNEYNDLAEKFLETYGLRSTTSNIVVKMEVDVLSDCNAFTTTSVGTYVSELRIPLTQKTVNIKMTSSVPASDARMIACNRGVGSEAFRTTAIVLGVADVLLVLLLIAFIYLTRTEDITYTAKVKKIVSQYKSYIQKIKTVFDTYGYQVIVVDAIDELLEIRDTIQAPILMHENDDKTCAKFMIPTDSKLLYLYEIKIEGYTEPEQQRRPEPTQTTIVKPNITNVVRPVVKVVVTPPPAKSEPEVEIETVLAEPEIEIEAAPDDQPEVVTSVEMEEETEEVEEIEEVIEEAEEVEEIENGVDAIDVFWPERRAEHKTYRYDPDGYSVESGDYVLVPTRDVASDREIVREAEVAKGNYKVDPETLNHPLKKIIGVVRRRAEKVFTAMITPDEENSDNE